MPPLIRRRPLIERIKAYLDLNDLLLWLSEELNDDTYDEVLNAWATPIGLAADIVFVLARCANRGSLSRHDDVFGDTGSARGWFTWLSSFIVHFLTVISCLNAFYTFYRKKHYRLFEQAVDVAPSTPSARRVRVQDSPGLNSPLQFLREAYEKATNVQHHPDAEKEVWEVGIWDAKPFNLTLFTLFSPGHLLIYYALLPAAVLDTRPTVTALLAIAFGLVLSLQLGYMRTSFDRQREDKALIQGEVIHEYNTKYVHPRLNRMMRDVSTQTRESTLSPPGMRTREVDVYTPTAVINRGFTTNPNPNYSGLYSHQVNDTMDMERDRRSSNANRITDTPRRRSSGYTQTPTMLPSGTYYGQPSPLKPSEDRPTRPRPLTNGSGDGYLGVYSNAASPLRKSASNQLLQKRVSEDTVGTISSSRQSTNSALHSRRETGRF